MGGGGRWWEVVGGGRRWWEVCDIYQIYDELHVQGVSQDVPPHGGQ